MIASAVSAWAPSARKPAASSASAAEVAPLPTVVDSNSGKPGYYTVKPGDTMIRIGLENGQNWRDIVRWNNLENPNIIEVGQVLRVVPPTNENPLVVTRPVSPGSAPPSSTSGGSGGWPTTRGPGSARSAG